MAEDMAASRQGTIIGVTAMLLCLSTLSVILRFIVRHTTRIGFWYDDYAIVVALVLSWVSPICVLVGTHYGLGKHAETLRPDQLTAYMKVLYTHEVVWTFTVPVIKLSLLLLFNRLFPVKSVRIATIAVGFFVVTWLLWAGLATILQCLPVESFWNPNIPKHCIDNNAFYIAAGAVNVFTSFAIISIPIPIICKLQKLSLAQKLGFVLLFTLGGWVCIVSIVRLVYLGRISPLDITWTDSWGAMWSGIEVSLDVVASNLPVIAPGLLKVARSTTAKWSNIRTGLFRSSRGKTTAQNTAIDVNKFEQDDTSMETMVDKRPDNGPNASGHLDGRSQKSVEETRYDVEQGV